MLSERNSLRRQTFESFLRSEPAMNKANSFDSHVQSRRDISFSGDDSSESCFNSDMESRGKSNLSGDNSPENSNESSPYTMSPWNQSSPYQNSPWIFPATQLNDDFPRNGILGSLVREEGHVYSLATSGDLLYTGSDSQNIRVWKSMNEFSGFKSHSGFVKAIVIHGEKIFTGHQDGKIRIWKAGSKKAYLHKRIGTLPSFRDILKSSVYSKNYVQARHGHNVIKIKHYDAVSCLTLNEDKGLLYSGSWDKTLKVWRISDFKCLDSITAHDDAINSVVAGFGSFVFTGSADGTVKVWRREGQGRGMRHFVDQVLLRQKSAVTGLAINESRAVVYGGASDGLVNFWEYGKYLTYGGVLRGHKMAVLCLATVGSLVFSGSADKSICVWRNEGDGVHTCLSVLTGHTGPIKCISVEDDSRGDEGSDGDRRWVVYSGSLDRTVKVWRVYEDAPDLQTVRMLEKQSSSE